MAEKGLNQISRADRELYEKGMAAVQRQNWNYAVAIFNQVLQHEPALYEAREAMRAVQLRLAGAKGGFFRKFFGAAGSSPQIAKAQLALRGNPLEAIRILESAIAQDPNSVTAHRMLAQAAMQAGLVRTAVLSLEIANKNSPNDREIAMELAEALIQAGQVERAQTVLAELEKARPHDQAVSQALKNVAARLTMKAGGYETLEGGEGSYRDILKNKEEAVSLEQQNREVKTADVLSRLIAEHEEQLAKEPGNQKIRRTLADYYSQKGDYDRALEYFQQIVSTEGGADPSLDRAITETKVRAIDRQIARLAQDPAQAARIRALEKSKAELRLSECQRLAEKYPSDLQIRFELGQLLFETGQINQAIQEFQRAQANPHKRTQALLYLGRCFEQRGMFDLAARRLQDALKEKQVFDDEKKELIYALGEVFEKMGKTEEALERFKTIYEIDIGYREVAAKVDRYYGAK